MKIATISLNIAWQDIEKNLVQAEKFILKAKTDGCDVVVLPEVFNTGFITILENLLSHLKVELIKHCKI